MKSIKRFNLSFLFRLILGFVFIYASYDKILDPISFSKNINNFHISPLALQNLAALIIPWIELIIGIFLIIGVFLEGSINLIISLLMFFIFILLQAIIRGIDVHCGCFSSEADIDKINLRFGLIKRVFEDFILLAMSFYVKNKVSKKNKEE